jgi:hypothetical protein
MFVFSLFYFFISPLFLNIQKIVVTDQISGHIWPKLAIGVFLITMKYMKRMKN